MEPPVDASSSRRLLGGRYQLEALIAGGGMGDVYQAHDERLQRLVAVKLLRADPMADRQRFEREIALLASIDHPGIVRVFDAGDDDGDAYLVLELIDGPTLRATAGDGPLEPDEVASLGVQLADALGYLHSRGVVHRDVTPSNVLRAPDGRVRLADFGIARLVDTTHLTQTSATIGTAAYMAPEQVEGREVTGAADVYALGLVLLELLTGRKAFEGSISEVAVARLTRSPDTSTDVPGAWPELLAAMTDRMAPNRPSAVQVRERLAAMAPATARAAHHPGAVAAVGAGAGAAAIGSDAPTHAMDAAAGGTAVLPAGHTPAPAAPARATPGLAAIGASAATAVRERPRVQAVLAFTAALLLGAAVASRDDGDLITPAVLSGLKSSTTTAPTTTAPTTTTTAPTTTEAPVIVYEDDD